MAGGRADTAAGTPCIGADAALLCSDGLGCSTDFLLIPNSGGSGFAFLVMKDSKETCLYILSRGWFDNFAGGILGIPLY